MFQKMSKVHEKIKGDAGNEFNRCSRFELGNWKRK